MPAPIAKGIIIGATILVAAGIALYENPKVREWIDQNRRKIAMAMNGESGGRPQHAGHAYGGANADEEWRRHQDRLARRRASIIRKAQEDGVAVDLDELAKVGTPDEWRPNPIVKRTDSGRSFDELVGSDGRLKAREMQEKPRTAFATSSDAHEPTEGLRARGRGEDGLRQGAVFANPFADEEAMGLHDDDLIGLSHDSDAYESSKSPSTLAARSPEQLVDVSEEPAAPIHAQSTSLYEVVETDTATQSFHSFASPPRSRASSISEGALTPTSEGFETGASVIGSNANDIAIMSPSLHSLHNDSDDTMSEFSEIGAGQSTPGSWTDVGSEAGSEWDLEHRQ